MDKILYIKLENKNDQRLISVKNAPVKELIDTLSAAKTFIHRTSNLNNKPIVSISEGSIGLEFDIPQQTREYLASYKGRGHATYSDPISILVSSLQRIAISGSMNIELDAEQMEKIYIDPKGISNFILKEPLWLESTLILNGTVIEMGGRSPNIHIDTEKYGIKTIEVDVDTIKSFRIYEKYAVEVTVQQNWDTPVDIKEAKYLSHIRLGDPISYGVFVERFGGSLIDSDGASSFFNRMRGRTNDED